MSHEFSRQIGILTIQPDDHHAFGAASFASSAIDQGFDEKLDWLGQKGQEREKKGGEENEKGRYKSEAGSGPHICLGRKGKKQSDDGNGNQSTAVSRPLIHACLLLRILGREFDFTPDYWAS